MSKILIIDDDSVTRMIVRQILQAQSYEVLEAETGEEGLKLAHQEQPALIVCDWQMPGMDGIEVCYQIKQSSKLSTTFFILLTSQNSVEHIVTGLDCGADEFLTKPIQSDELVARIRAGLRLYQSLEQSRQLAAAILSQQKLLEAELAEAAAYVQSLLPSPMSGAITIDPYFLPCRGLGGDCFDYYWLDENRLVFYVLDVSGHGLKAALLSVSIKNWLRSQIESQSQEPHQVLENLNFAFGMAEHNDQYFTIWYGVYHVDQKMLSYASAGHPPGILFSDAVRAAGDARRLKSVGTPIGMFEKIQYVSNSCKIQTPSTLYLFSDGLYEVRQTLRNWNLEHFIAVLFQHSQAPQSLELAQIIENIQAINHIRQFDDDCVLLKIQFS